MKIIWKYKLSINDNIDHSNTLSLPKGAKVLIVREQYDTICLWVEVDANNAERETRCFEVFGTGHEIHTDMGIDRTYLGTAFTSDGRFVCVWHVYERLN